MVDTVAIVGVELEINDREYSRGAKRATDDTQKLSDKTKNLKTDLKNAESAARSAGSGMNDLGKNAEKASGRLQKLRTELQSVNQGMSTIGLGEFGALATGGFLGAGLMSAAGMAAEAAAATNGVMSHFGIASGGNAAMFNAMNDLYRQLNSRTTIPAQSVGNISSQITKQFGWMPEGDRLALASQISAWGEAGEDPTMILNALNKIARNQGMQYGLGEFDMSQLLGRLSSTAVQTNSSFSETAASLAAIMQGTNNQLKPGNIMEMLIAGNQLYGSSAAETSARVMQEYMRTQEPTTFANEDFRRGKSVADQIFESEFKRYWHQPLQEVDAVAGMYPTSRLQSQHEAELWGKGVRSGLGDVWNRFIGNALSYRGRSERMYQGLFPEHLSPQANQAPNITINFNSSNEPNIELQKTRERYAYFDAIQIK